MSRRFAYYQELKQLARETRKEHGLTDCRVLPSEVRRVMKNVGIERIDRRPLKKVRGLYVSDALGCSVLVNSQLPRDPYAFTLAHELKHHLCDRHLTFCPCTDSNSNEAIEIGAEIFAAEFLFPEDEYLKLLEGYGIQAPNCTADDIVRIKHETDCTLSYAALAKRTTFFGFAPEGAFTHTRWRKVEETLFGVVPWRKKAGSWSGGRGKDP